MEVGKVASFTIRVWTLLMALLMASTSASVLSSPSPLTDNVVQDPLLRLYPYRLVTSSHFGRIRDSALPGSQVPVDDSLSASYPMDRDSRYIRLGLIPNHFFNQSTEAKTAKASSNQTTESAAAATTILPSLPPGMGWEVGVEEREEGVVRESSHKGSATPRQALQVFTVGADFYVVVRDPRELSDVNDMAFWVVAVRHAAGKDDNDDGDDEETVSNPVAFIVKIDHDDQPDERGDESSPVYVGIIVLVICMFVLLIPLTVRTKRRMREGKPVCTCGSSQEKLDKKRMRQAEKETGNGSSTANVQTTSGPGLNSSDRAARESLALSLYGGTTTSTSRSGSVVDHHHASDAGPSPRRESFQHKSMRSESEHHFQPRWLDPHFKDVYEHPYYYDHDRAAVAASCRQAAGVTVEEGEGVSRRHHQDAGTTSGAGAGAAAAAASASASSPMGVAASTSKSADVVVERL